MYIINADKVTELKDGRTHKIIAEKVGCSETHINQIFLGNKKCSETLAKLLILLLTDCTNNGIALEDALKYYFKKIKS